MKKRLPTVGLVRAAGLAILLLVTTMTPTATAQEFPETGGRVFGLVGGSFGDGKSAVLVSGGAGLRMTRQLGLDFEVLHVSGLDRSDEDFVIQPLSIFPPIDLNRNGGLTAFMSKIAIDFPANDRVIPIVSGGGGVGHLSEQITFGANSDIDIDPGLSDRVRDIRRGGRPFIFPPFPTDFDRSQTGLVLTFGGGVDVRLWKGFSVGAEARWLRFFANREGLDFAHVASRIVYRF